MMNPAEKKGTSKMKKMKTESTEGQDPEATTDRQGAETRLQKSAER